MELKELKNEMINKSKPRVPRWLIKTAIAFFIIFLIAVAASAALYLTFEKKYQGKIYPGIYLGEIELGRKTPAEAAKAINDKINEIYKNGINFYYQNSQTAIFPVIESVESDLAYPLINFDGEEAVSDAYNFGRKKNFLGNLRKKIRLLFSEKKMSLAVSVEDEKIKKMLEEKFAQSEIPAYDAELIYEEISVKTATGTAPGIKFSVKKEKAGKIINFQEGIDELKTRLSFLNNTAIELSSIAADPKIYQKDCLNIDAKAQKILTIAPLTLKHGGKEWLINKKRLAEWLALKINSEMQENYSPENKIIVGLAENKIKNFLIKEAAPEINQPAIEAKFSMHNGRVNEFQASQDGSELDIDASILKINAAVDSFDMAESQDKKIIELPAKELKSSVSVGNINNLGVKEIIGIGKSNFAGSPKNRRHNIKVGADALNGLLIKPEEEFSLLKALGNIDASAGYLPELVIKENKTIPEFGGGLCQIGTTMFRGALSTGLPITARRNHSYRVVYYEPAGTDATIYNPAPDLRFINDTSYYILIQSRLEGDNLYFDFWGTKDGRAVEQTKSVIYNIVRPGQAKLIETLDLKPGEKKCTERAHSGADAYFNYKVTYANGEVKENKFSSHYVPWREVCLIGVEKLTVDIPPENKNTEQPASGAPSADNQIINPPIN